MHSDAGGSLLMREYSLLALICDKDMRTLGVQLTMLLFVPNFEETTNGASNSAYAGCYVVGKTALGAGNHGSVFSERC